MRHTQTRSISRALAGSAAANFRVVFVACRFSFICLAGQALARGGLKRGARPAFRLLARLRAFRSEAVPVRRRVAAPSRAQGVRSNHLGARGAGTEIARANAEVGDAPISVAVGGAEGAGAWARAGASGARRMLMFARNDAHRAPMYDCGRAGCACVRACAEACAGPLAQRGARGGRASLA